MNDDGTFNFGVIMFIFGMLFTIFFVWVTNQTTITLDKREWNCTQSRILDPQNVDKIECTNYRKKDNDIGG